MSFHQQRLQQLRTAAGLGSPAVRRAVVRYMLPVEVASMPSFYSPGYRLPCEPESEYINSAYFSPEALRWADAVVEFRAKGGAISRDDEECFARVWAAMRAGREPTAPQLKECEKNWKWTWAESRIPELYALEMRKRGVLHYGPDHELPASTVGPGSDDELIYRHLFRELGYKNPKSAKANHKSWKRQRRERASLVSASP